MSTDQTIDDFAITILENLLENILVFDKDGDLIYACDKFYEDTGIPAEGWKGKNIREILKKEYYKPFAANIAFEKKERVTVVQEVFDREISVATAVPIKDRQGHIKLYISYAQNNDEIIRLEEKLNQMNALLEERNREIALLKRRGRQVLDSVENSPAIEKVRQTISQVKDFDANILLTGETGTGKSMYAAVIHAESVRKDKPFVEINCSAIPENLIESELFGYEKGAFTGANTQGKKGQIELAHQGTLFLDEIGELPFSMQSKLLKVIQTKSFSRVGGTETIHTDFRLIAATNMDLEALVQQKLFRADLFYRLNVISIHIPPLRERKDDIFPLCQHFLETFNDKYHQLKRLTPQALDTLIQYSWPGNVRELENTIERLVLTVDHSDLCEFDLPETIKTHINADVDKGSLKKALDELEKQMILSAYEASGGNISQMARQLGITRQSTLRRIDKYREKK